MSRYIRKELTGSLSPVNSELEKIQNSIKELLSRTGETPNQMLANLDMNSQRIINLPFPQTPSEPLRLGDVVSTQASEVLVPPTYFNIADYGALPSNLDNKAAIDAAIADLSDAGGGVLYIPRGIFYTSGNHTLVSNMSVQGEGYCSCLKRTFVSESNYGNSIFSYVNPLRPAIGISNVSFFNLRLEGVWDNIYKELGTNSEIVIVGVDGFTMTNCWVKNAAFGSIVLNQSKNAHVHGNWFINSARDMCRLWNTDNSSVVGNTFLHNDDDCISINRAGFDPVEPSGRVRQGIIVANNYLQDTGGIRIQDAMGCVVLGNVIQLNKGNAAIKFDCFSTAGVKKSNVHTSIIANNIITNVLDRLLARQDDAAAQSSNLRVAIKVKSANWTDYDVSNTYEYFYTNSGDANQNPLRVNSQLIITGNIVKRTLPVVTRYSDWGFGKMFTRFKTTEVVPGYIVNGEANPAIVDANLRCRPLEIRDGLKYTSITNNLFEGSGTDCVLFLSEEKAAGSHQFTGLEFKNNVFRDFRATGINLTDYENTRQSIIFSGNTFDGDPYFKDTFGRHTDGSSNFTGGWTAQEACVAIDARSVEGLVITDNDFKNVSGAYLFGGSGAKEHCWIRFNRLWGQPSTSANPRVFDVSNRGVGVYPADMDEEASLIYVNSNPQTANYLDLLEQQVRSRDSAPTTGYYFLGQIVWARSGVVSNGSVQIGWRRLTDGTSHVLGTDWQPLFASITA